MQATFLLLVLCAQGGDGRRIIDNSDEREASEARTPDKALIQSLLAMSPAVSKRHELGAADLNAPARPRRAQIKMQSVKQLRERSESVSKSKAITEAMRLVAAARVKKATDATLLSRPFTEGIQKALGGLVDAIDESDRADIPPLQTREVKKVTIVTIAGDRGLCGGFNGKVIKATETRIAELEKQGIEVELVTVGVKVNVYYRKRANKVLLEQKLGDPDAENAAEIGDLLLSRYFSADTDRVELIYTKFVSMSSSEPVVQTLLPFTDLSVEGAEEKKEDEDSSLEQSAEILIDDLGGIFLTAVMFAAYQNSIASELAARVLAMQAATDNAEELYALLIRKMNRKRQGRITADICEIVAGAAAGEEGGE
jgi:F-type H+-transporting ATPase subunit gamma